MFRGVIVSPSINIRIEVLFSLSLNDWDTLFVCIGKWKDTSHVKFREAQSRCLAKHVKDFYEMSMSREPECWSEMSMLREPECWSDFFFNPPAHVIAVTCITEILFIVTLGDQYSFTHFYSYIICDSLIFFGRY